MSEVTGQQTTLEQNLHQTLNKTDFGHLLYENRKILLALALATIVGITSYVIWREAKESRAMDHSLKVFEFQTTTWKEAKEGKVSVADLVSAFEKLDHSVQKSPVMIPVALEIGKFLFEKGASAEAESILGKVGQDGHHPVAAFFVGMQRAVHLEKLGKIQEAAAVLESLAKGPESLMPAKVSVELGRLYLALEEKGKAQIQFEHVVNSYPNESEAKLAKLYLSQLAR